MNKYFISGEQTSGLIICRSILYLPFWIKLAKRPEMKILQGVIVVCIFGLTLAYPSRVSQNIQKQCYLASSRHKEKWHFWIFLQYQGSKGLVRHILRKNKNFPKMLILAFDLINATSHIQHKHLYYTFFQPLGHCFITSSTHSHRWTSMGNY